MSSLLDARGVPRLRELTLHNCRFEDAFFAALVRSPLVRQLRKLFIGSTRMTDTGALEILRGMAQLANLEKVWIQANTLSAPIAAQLRAFEPRIKIDLPWGVLPIAGDASSRWVRHARFGRGHVVDVKPGGKLVVNFEGARPKIVLSQFVTEES